MLRVTVLGAAGQLGVDVASAAAGHHAVAALPRAEADVTEAAAVDAALARTRPEVVVNCAAYVNVDACEGDGAEAAWRVNVAGSANVARASARYGARLVHVSTNYVFDGDRDEPYAEDDLPAPRGMYAITKLAGEHAALAYCPDALVVRTAGLYGAASNRSKGGSFVDRIIARARSGAPLEVVDDQRLTPTASADLAAAVVAAIEAEAAGVVHLTNDGACTWHAFAVAIVAAAGLDVPVVAVSTRPRAGTASRPRNGVLARPRADALGLPLLPHWRQALLAYLAAVGASAGDVRGNGPPAGGDGR